MPTVQPRRWFITGVSTGFGRVLALELVRRGERVAGSVRQPEQAAPLEAAGVSAVLLDVNDADRAAPAVAEAITRLGGIDILVNNAGFGLMGAIEALDEQAIRGVMETNFFGALRVTRAAIPELRSHGGVIISISSMAGMVGIAGAGAYCASKFALEALSETLSQELAPFGVKVLIVEPGAFRTDFSGRSIKTAETRVEAYAGTQAGEVASLLQKYHGHEPGDPAKAVAAILTALESPVMPLRLMLGADAVGAIQEKQDKMRAEIAEWKAVSLATAFAST
jgi:NAD(P)-dependent dehydrogenase (short-subunit alcohol dehydrogenase family)